MKSFSILKVQLVREAPPPEWGSPVVSPEGAIAAISRFIGSPDREMFGILMLDSKGRPTGIHLVSMGSLNASLVHPREVFTVAITCKAASLILWHNHPSGELTPSLDDLELTSRLVDAGKILGIGIHDHVIICESTHLSMRKGAYNINWVS